MKRSYALIIEKGKETFAGYFPEFPGCTTMGENRAEVVKNAKEALALYLGYYKSRGDPLPDSSEAIGLELVEIADEEIEWFDNSAGVRPGK